jgi:hypothetical protein
MNEEDHMKTTQLLVTISAALMLIGSGAANAARTVAERGALACVTDKWNESEPDKGHKVVDYAGRCVDIPDDAAVPKLVEDCVGTYEFMPDESWKGSGTCTVNYRNGDKEFKTWEEGSHLRAYVYTVTGGTGEYEGASGGGTYTLDQLTDTLYGGRYEGKLEQP